MLSKLNYFLIALAGITLAYIGIRLHGHHTEYKPVGYSVDTKQLESNIVNKITATLNLKLQHEARDRLKKAIIGLSSVERPFVLNMLKETLDDTEEDMHLMLEELLDYQQRPKITIPKTALSKNTVLRYTDYWKNYSLPLIVSTALGGVGNVMGQYATVYSLHRIFNMTGLIATTLESNLNRFYENISMESVDIGLREDYDKNGWTVIYKDHNTAPSSYHGLELAAGGLLGPKRFLTAHCPIEVQLFTAFQDDLRYEFQFNDYLLNRANDELASIGKKATLDTEDGSPTFVGIHVRLKDYVNHAKRIWGISDISSKYRPYLLRAMQYYRSHYENLVFVMASDDPEYLKDFLRETKTINAFITTGTQGEDLSLLTRCNHSIVTLGTFGFWSAFLKTSGETVYPDVRGELAKTYHFTKAILENAKVQSFIPMAF